MIKSAAASVSGSLVLGKGAQAAPADDAAVSTDFAALLESTAATGQDGAADPAITADPATAKQLRQANGKAAGKKLPLDLQDIAAKLAATDSAKPADGSAEDTAPTDDAAPALPAITTPIVLPGLVVPVSVQLPQTPEPTAATPTAPAPVAIPRSTTESLAQAAAAQASRSVLPGPAEAVRVAKIDKSGTAAQSAAASPAQVAASLLLPQTAATELPAAAAPATSAKADGTAAIPAPRGEPAFAAAILAASPKRSDQVGVTVARAEKPAGAQSAAGPATATAIVPVTPVLADQVRVTVASAEQPAPAATSTSAQLVSAQAAAPVIEQVTGHAAATAKAVEQPVAAPATPAQAAEIAPAQVVANTVQPSAAAAPRREVATPTADTPVTPAKAAAAAEAPAAPAQAPTAVPAQPLFAMQDGQSFSQATVPVTSAPTANAVGQTGHDFATLVDRLVEARDAASPNSVHAAITHSEFGQVSLRFDQDANGLSVAMSSADPEFARAVQASSAQSQMSGDNNNDRNNDRGAPRQDTSSQQQTAGSASGQSQSQAQTSASGRDDRNTQAQNATRTGRTSGQQTQDADTADTRAGIYA